MKLKRRSMKRGRVEIIPMIDTILILLIFYMSFSTFTKKEKRIDAKLPLVSVGQPIATTEVPMDITLHVKNKDEILVNGAPPCNTDTLRAQMMTLSTVGQNVCVVIEAEPDTPYQAVIGALDACALAHLTKVAFRPLQDKQPSS
jgi:biopolymer transport protein ExbD